MRAPAAPTVVKLGGSLVADAPRLRACLAQLADGAAGACVIVPGGGPLAEGVRSAQAALGFSDALAHRLALDAMGRMAEILSALEPRLVPARDPEAFAGILAAGRVPVWDPLALKAGHPDIPETWAVTSDSLALWLAAAIGAPRCCLVKFADRPAGADWADLARSGLVDVAFPAFAARYAGRIEILGPGAAYPPGRDSTRAAA
ncbi:uridylate kinase [Methylobacterium sp. Leaf104]|uniref:amino acid kinase family protein n=1 Tax=Methylobacterium TaxID=407 RepID=UPI0006FDF563|nr:MULTISPECIES: uridylate kinase [Methylobacterium]KQP41302.1 uridylate kinase [Methylobacterium sp. Leaf104]MCI9879303.1 uridylate kinase [Methylobacterium goesingense]